MECQILTEAEIKRIQAIELDILKACIEVCNKLNIRYYVAYGTLIGAIRHKGFIPWDDDIDIMMPREEYDIFNKHAQEYLPEHYFLQNAETDKEYLGGFTKIRDSRTTFIESNYKDRCMNHGIYIDVFPLEYWPKAPFSTFIMQLKRKLNSLRLRKEIIVIKEKANHNAVMAFAIDFFASIYSFLTPNYYKFAKKREEYLRRLSKSPSKYYCSFFSTMPKPQYPITWFGEGIKKRFEDIDVVVPIEYDKLLKSIYGDYMQLPPKEKQFTRHFTEVIDTTKDYSYYINKNKL